MADDPVDPLPVAPPVLATSTSIFPSLRACGPEEFRATLETVMPAAAQDLVMTPTVTASRALGPWYPIRTVWGAPPRASRAPAGSALTNGPASAAPSPAATASWVAGSRRELAIGTPASCAIASRGVHSANARRALACAR